MARARSTTRAMCEPRTDRNDAMAPSRNAGAAACEMTSESWSVVSISFNIFTAPVVDVLANVRFPAIFHIVDSLTDLRIGRYWVRADCSKLRSSRSFLAAPDFAPELNSEATKLCGHHS